MRPDCSFQVERRQQLSAASVIPQDDSSGGSGANFIVKWQAAAPANPPIVETVMIGTQSQFGISFTSRDQMLQN
ncbi:DUF3124 domain-containing protein [Desulfoprunum benzoelyticum]|uniref:DUF3124 domain-containing protein n=1 Tax=Desulfoprunum benzoelyticum TaxID=1506996 RepID=UPI001609E006|nr:DUF3124 domain-containing protein [Desulfoprunum benzoelyticum]MBM9531452.1 DUF3124 domain-containing protein [Desulfoprunum benzoelyticum]